MNGFDYFVSFCLYPSMNRLKFWPIAFGHFGVEMVTDDDKDDDDNEMRP